MPEYHVGAGVFEIYAGTLDKSGTKWKSKSVVTEEAIAAVRDYMLDDCLGIQDGPLEQAKTNGGYAWTRKDGSVVELRILVKEKDDG